MCTVLVLEHSTQFRRGGGGGVSGWGGGAGLYSWLVLIGYVFDGLSPGQLDELRLSSADSGAKRSAENDKFA